LNASFAEVKAGAWAPDDRRRSGLYTFNRQLSDCNCSLVRRGEKPIAAICHVAQILAAADVIRGRRVSGMPRAPEVRLAGGEYVETPPDGAIRDDDLVTGFA
jgi:hypothetical protein